MSTGYDREDRFTTTGADEIVEFAYPSRCELTKITGVREGGGNIALDLFSRKFTSAALAIRNVSLVVGGAFDGKTRLQFPIEFGVARPGDQIVVAGNTIAGYNVTHRVEALSDDKLEVITNQAWTADGFGGTAALAIAAADQELYRVLPQVASASPLLEIPTSTGDSALFRNQDPLGNSNIGLKRILYIKVADAATYRLSISSVLSVAGEG